jgi:sugar lactone lactonase YvrE
MLPSKFLRRLLLAALVGAGSTHAAHPADVKIASATSAVLTPDTKTLIFATPNDGAIVYVSAETERELKKVELDFKPSSMAVQGKNLFVSAQGSGTIHVLDVDSGKESTEVKIPGEPVVSLACHQSKGLSYATNLSDEVFAIDPEKGKATKTKAVEKMIVVDPNDGKLGYTGIQKTIRDQLVLEERASRLGCRWYRRTRAPPC